MKVLVTWGSKRGGTEGIARIIGETLQHEGLVVDLLPSRRALRPAGYDAVVVGGALYANRWHPDARRFVDRHVTALGRVPVWFFSSGPLDDSADRQAIAPIDQVVTLMERVGAQGHVTFGGRLAGDARGFPAAAMAKKRSGDWRNPERIREWAAGVARAVPIARPRAPIEQPARSPARLVAYGFGGWAVWAAVLGLLMRVAPRAAGVAGVLLAPLIFAPVARAYFAPRGARDPLPTAIFFAAEAALFNLAVFSRLGELDASWLARPGPWLSYALIALATWTMGVIATVIQPLKETHSSGSERRTNHVQYRSSQTQ